MLAAATALLAAPLRAQESAGSDGASDTERSAWRLGGLRDGFCIETLIDPTTLAREIPGRVRLLRADSVDLHPALRTVVANQPEYAGWSPSSLCVYVFDAVVAGSRRIGGDPRKPPVLAFWTVAAADRDGQRRDLALELLASSGDLDDAAHDVNLDPDRLHYTQGPLPREDGPPRPGETRYRLRIDHTTLTWDGREGSDSGVAGTPVSRSWMADGEHGTWVTAALTLAPESERAMLGSLRVQGEDLLARALHASPTRFVGPLLSGGTGVLRFTR